jgi:hypothetical protein
VIGPPYDTVTLFSPLPIGLTEGMVPHPEIQIQRIRTILLTDSFLLVVAVAAIILPAVCRREGFSAAKPPSFERQPVLYTFDLELD